MKRRSMRTPGLRIATTALLSLGLMAQAGATSAGAVEVSADVLTVISTTGPVGAKLPSLTELRANWAQHRGAPSPLARDSGAARGSTPLETTGPAASWAPDAGESASVADPPRSVWQSPIAAADDDSPYPEPAHTLSAAECRTGLGSDKKFFIKSRFAVCSGASFTQTWLRNRKPVGASTFGFLAIGTIPKGSRTMNVHYQFVEMKTTGQTGVSTFMITPHVAVPQVWPSTAKTSTGGNVPGARSFTAIKAQSSPGFQHSMTVAAGQGDGRDDTVFAVYQPSVTMRAGGGWSMGGATSGKPFFLAPRWDNATYLGSDGGAAVMSYTVSMPFSTQAGAPERLAAQHIKDAYNSPASTKPENSKKDIPGQTADRPLTRLFHDTSRRNANRRAAISACKKYWGDDYAKGGKECDEFPFASTYQGAAQANPKYDPQGKAPKNNFSARPIPKTDNGAGGRIMSGFYLKNRIIDGPNDGFLVKVD